MIPSRAHDEALAELLGELDRIQTVYPDTSLRLVCELLPSTAPRRAIQNARDMTLNCYVDGKSDYSNRECARKDGHNPRNLQSIHYSLMGRSPNLVCKTVRSVACLPLLALLYVSCLQVAERADQTFRKSVLKLALQLSLKPPNTLRSVEHIENTLAERDEASNLSSHG